MTDFPLAFIRGIPKLDNINKERNTVMAALFIPNSKTSQTRSDQGQEISINWEDDGTVLSFTLTMPKENNLTSLAFPHGAVRLLTEVLDEVNNKPATANTLTYERNTLENNPYHGNIVFKSGLPGHTISMIASVLAYSAGNVL